MIVVVDFDGTLIKTNSFKQWIKFVLKKSFVTLNLNILFRVLVLLFKRKVISMLSHVEFKKQLNEITYPTSWSCEFLRCLYKKILCRVVLQTIEGLTNVSEVIISTAAPACYAKNIPDIFLINNDKAKCFCSYQKDTVFFDNFRENKVETLSNNKITEFILFTDHSDDMPLAKKANSVYLCNPSKETRLIFENEMLAYNLLKGS